jgi:hypothetical protein
MEGWIMRAWKVLCGAGIVAVVLAVALIGCCESAPPAEVILGPPHVIWDHDRRRPPGEWRYIDADETQQTITLPYRIDTDTFENPAAFDPNSGAQAPRAFVTPAPPPDGLPDAVLRARYNGARLPLNDAALVADLVDYLGADRFASVGLTRAESGGALPEAVRKEYGAILGYLAEGPFRVEDVTGWAGRNDAEIYHPIADPRFQRSSFAARVAVKGGAFWFVFPRVRDLAAAPRLVVAPVRAKRAPPVGRPTGG